MLVCVRLYDQSINQLINQSINQSISQSIYSVFAFTIIYIFIHIYNISSICKSKYQDPSKVIDWTFDAEDTY